MTDKQPEALRLAEQMEDGRWQGMFDLLAAAELRRLHEVNTELVEALSYVIRGVPDTWEGVQKAKEVLDKAKEQNNE